jgi:FkbM family methyltransferase
MNKYFAFIKSLFNYKKIKKWIKLSLILQHEQYRLAADLQATKKELEKIKSYVNDYESVVTAPLLAKLLAKSSVVSEVQINEVIKSLKKYNNPYKAFLSLLTANPKTSLFHCQLSQYRELFLNKVEIDKKIIRAMGWNKKITIIDVGAQMLESSDHVYSPLVKSVPTKIIGFEPLSDELEKRVKAERNVEIYSYMIGNGKKRKFNITQFKPASSNLSPNFNFLNKFHAMNEMLKVEETIDVETIRLDEIKQIKDCDLLKLDVQGSELDILKGSKEILKDTCVVYLEVEHSMLYEMQPLHSEIDIYLREAGFEFVDFRDPGYITYRENNRGYGGSRRAWSDAIYFKNDNSIINAGAKKILKSAIIAHCNYAMWDLAAHYLTMYDEMTKSSLAKKYIWNVDKQVYPKINTL